MLSKLVSAVWYRFYDCDTNIKCEVVVIIWNLWTIIKLLMDQSFCSFISISFEFINFINLFLSFWRYTSKDICKVLIGNKQDLEPLREVTTEDAQTLSEIHGMLSFLETSAKESTNVNEVCYALFPTVLEISRHVVFLGN